MKRLKQKLKNRLVQSLFNVPTEDSIYTYNKAGKHFIDGVELTEGEIISIGQEVRNFRATRLYNILFSTVNRKAEKMMFHTGLTPDEMRGGRMLLMATNLQDKIMDKVSKTYEKQIRDK